MIGSAWPALSRTQPGMENCEMRQKQGSAHVRLTTVLAALAAILVLGLGSIACDDDDDGVKGSGNVVTRDFEFTDFTKVRLSSAFDAEITRSDTYSVSVRVDDNILDLIEVDTSGDTLSVGAKSGASFRSVTLEATITMLTMSGIELSGASSVDVTGFDGLGSLDVQVSGASSIDGDFEADSVDLSLSGASRIEGEYEADSIDLALSGASNATLGGSAENLTLDVSGASDADLEDFVVATADVELSGASKVTVNVEDRLESVDASGASRLRYLGNPSLGSVNTSGASTIDQIDN